MYVRRASWFFPASWQKLIVQRVQAQAWLERALGEGRLTLQNERKDPASADVVWHGDARARCAVYRFNTRRKQQLFCPRCGASLGIDFAEAEGRDGYGISVGLPLLSFLISVALSLLLFSKKAGTGFSPSGSG